MNKNKKIRLFVSILTMLLVLNLFLVSSSSVEAKADENHPFYVKPLVTFDYDYKIALDPLLPIDNIKEIPISMNLTLTGYYAEELLEYLSGKTKLFADISVVGSPDYCEASISPKKVDLYIEKGGSVRNASLSLVINKVGHALTRGIVLIEVDIKGAGTIADANFTKEIEFIPGYLPFLEFETESKTKKITPDETAEFKIKVKNSGNAITNVSFEIIEKPKDWIVELPKNVELDKQSDIILSVRGPKSFGYHNDRENITIKVVPSHYKNLSLKGKEYFLNFIVQSKGFSTPGFEPLTFLFTFIIVIFLFKTKKKKFKKNEGGHKYD